MIDLREHLLRVGLAARRLDLWRDADSVHVERLVVLVGELFAIAKLLVCRTCAVDVAML